MKKKIILKFHSTYQQKTRGIVLLQI